MFKRVSGSLTLLAVLAACSESGSVSPAAPLRDVRPNPINGPAEATDGSVSFEVLKVCKYGSTATVFVTEDMPKHPAQFGNPAYGGHTENTFDLVDGTGSATPCLVVADQNRGDVIKYTVTETGSPAGYQLDSMVVRSADDPPETLIGVNTVTLEKPRSLTQGFVIEFYNSLIPVGEIGDFVWSDLNGDGIQDAGEPGIAGQTVTLGGDASASTTTDASGHYLFTGLRAGNYTVTVGTPAGTAPSPSNAGGDPTKDSNGSVASVSLATNASIDHSIDFGFVPPLGEIGDYVWRDLNANGIQDAGEPGIAGVTVTLSGAASASTTTDASGKYLFSGLSAGSYTVTAATPAGLAPTTSNAAGSTPDNDSNGSPAAVTLPSNVSTNYSIDFGYIFGNGGKCVATIGYWKNHSAQAKGHQSDEVTPRLPIWLGTPLGPKSVYVTSSAQAVDLLSMNVGSPSNGITKLYAQMLGAKLGIVNGADGAPIASTISAADAFLATHNQNDWSSLTAAEKNQVNAWMTTFDNFNNGKMGSPHC